VNALAPPALYDRRPPLIDAVLAGRGLRLYTSLGDGSDLRDVVRGPAGWSDAATRAYGQQDVLAPPIASRWGVLGSYDGDFTGLAPPAVDAMAAVLSESAQGPRAALGRKLLQMAGVTHVTALQPEVFGGLPAVAQQESVFARPVRLFAVPDPVPLVYVVGRSRIAYEPRSYLDTQDPGFDPAREVILAGGERLAAPAGFEGQARVRWRRSDAMGVDVEATHPAYLVVVERYQTGWSARVDGAASTIVRGNILFRAVRVDPGHHLVELRYEPPGLRTGLAFSALGVALVLAAWWPRRLNAAERAPNMAPP
jgi:hypothetical protein